MCSNEFEPNVEIDLDYSLDEADMDWSFDKPNVPYCVVYIFNNYIKRPVHTPREKLLFHQIITNQKSISSEIKAKKHEE